MEFLKIQSTMNAYIPDIFKNILDELPSADGYILDESESITGHLKNISEENKISIEEVVNSWENFLKNLSNGIFLNSKLEKMGRKS
jgi:hypothetical protein